MSRSEILLVGTADGLAIFQAGAAPQLLRHTLAGVAVRAIAAADPTALLVAADGLPPQQSFDGGATWFEASGPPPEPIGLRAATISGPEELAFPRLGGATAYARLGGRGGALLGAGAGGMQLFLSFNDGIHWDPAQIEGGPHGRVIALAPSATDRSVAWAGTDSGALLRSVDGGLHWHAVATAPAPVLCLTAVVADDDTE
ncbi:MAG: hypothetical protein DIU80_002765 [Chloroflexota bacterium]